jgi:hypothetical protein
MFATHILVEHDGAWRVAQLLAAVPPRRRSRVCVRDTTHAPANPCAEAEPELLSDRDWLRVRFQHVLEGFGVVPELAASCLLEQRPDEPEETTWVALANLSEACSGR